MNQKFLQLDEVIEKIRLIAKSCGWAIAVHGSLKRDIDLIGIPWVEDAVPQIELYMKLRKHFDSAYSSLGEGLAAGKPHGRWGCILFQKGAQAFLSKRNNGSSDWNPPAIDLSLVDKRA